MIEKYEEMNGEIDTNIDEIIKEKVSFFNKKFKKIYKKNATKMRKF